MTPRQRLEIEQSEKRQRLNALLAKPAEGDSAMTDAERAELPALTDRMQSIEIELRAAIVAEAASDAEAEAERRAGANGDGEAAELRALVDGVRLGRYMGAAAEHRALDGRERELNDHIGLGNAVPWEALEDRAEHRAITEAPATHPINQQPILGRIFASSDTQFLDVDQPMVGVGQPSYPTLSGGVVAADAAKGAAIAGDAVKAATWTVATVQPSRVSASYQWNIEGAGVFPNLESALRRDLREAMQTAIDRRVVSKLLAAAGGLADPANPSAVAKFQDVVDQYAGFVDGRFATGVGQVKLMVNPGTYQKFYQLYLGTGDGQTDQTAAERAMSIGGGLRVSSHIPAAAANIAASILVRGAGWAVAPVWQGVAFVLDQLTGAAKGEVTLTAQALVGFAMRRASGEQAKRVDWKLA